MILSWHTAFAVVIVASGAPFRSAKSQLLSACSSSQSFSLTAKSICAKAVLVIGA